MSEQSINEKNLDDLILEEPEPNNNKKGLLLILGLVVLLLIIGVVLANMIMGGGEESNKTQKVQEKELATITDNKKNNIKTDELESKNENLDADLAPLDNDNLDKEDVDIVEPKEENTNIKNAASAAAATTATALAAKSVTQRREKKVVKKVVHPKKKIVHKKAVVHKSTPHQRISYGGVGSVYIQVGSFAKGPSQAFINKIRRSGFKYRIQEVNGFRRVLVGPFKNKNEAMQVLGVVKEKISSAAFIKR